MTGSELVRAAIRRYLDDPLFHARVDAAVSALAHDIHAFTGYRMDDDHDTLVTTAAALGLLMAEIDPRTGEKL